MAQRDSVSSKNNEGWCRFPHPFTFSRFLTSRSSPPCIWTLEIGYRTCVNTSGLLSAVPSVVLETLLVVRNLILTGANFRLSNKCAWSLPIFSIKGAKLSSCSLIRIKVFHFLQGLTFYLINDVMSLIPCTFVLSVSTISSGLIFLGAFTFTSTERNCFTRGTCDFTLKYTPWFRWGENIHLFTKARAGNTYHLVPPPWNALE